MELFDFRVKYKMENVNFCPWVGTNYENSMFGIKILILGESHYAENDDEPDSDWTQHVVKHNAQDHPNAFFTKITKAVLGLYSEDELSEDTRSNFWEHVAFYNYVQDIVGESGRIRPINEMWEAAERPFLAVVKSLKPDVVIVLGSILGEWVPVLNDNVKVAYLYHPSSSHFNYEGVIPAIQKAIEDAKRESRP